MKECIYYIYCNSTVTIDKDWKSSKSLPLGKVYVDTHEQMAHKCFC